MKSLNEVIKANECCDHGELDSRCEDCPYNGIGACCLERETDAFHYLKDMKNLEEDYDILYNKYWREYNQQQANPALTWDELKQMEGKPVWIEGPFITEGPHWIIVGPSHLYNGKIVGYGKTWQAYKRENENTR